MVLLAGKEEMRAEGGTMLLEGLAIRYSLRMCKQFDLEVHQVESDNKNIIGKVNGHIEAEVYCDIVVEEVRKKMKDIGCSETIYIPRQANKVAHHIARGPVFIDIMHRPEHVALFLEKDVIDS